METGASLVKIGPGRPLRWLGGAVLDLLFPPVCLSCDFYKSVYKPVIGRKRADFYSIDEFKQHLDGRAVLKRDMPSVA